MKIIITALAATMLFFACGNKAKESTAISELNKTQRDEETISDFKTQGIVGEMSVDTTGTTTQQVQNRKEKEPGSTPNTKQDWDKKIIKNATLDLEVKDYNVYYASLRDKVRGLGGYISQEEQTQTEYKIQNVIVVKIPVDQFENALQQLTLQTEKINEKKVTSQDVTTEYIDTRSRMESKKQVRLKYLDLLKQAKNMEEILNVQSEINGIQEEIESAVGRIEYLSNSSSFSTITLTYYQVLDPTAVNKEIPGFGTKLGNAFKNGGHWLVDLFVGLVSIWPLFLLVFAGIIIYKKTRKANSETAKPLT